MTPPDLPASDPQDRRQEYYIERNLKIPDFVRWAGGDPPGDDPPGEGGASTRLRSVIGPPGCGKSMFLDQLKPALRAGGCHVLWLDIKILGALPDGLLEWLRTTVDSHKVTGFAYDSTALFSGNFESFLRRFGASPLVLLVDSFEDISPDSREVLETQVFAPFLFPPGEAADNRYAVIARRDEYGLQEALLRWEDYVHELKGIDFVVSNGPMEQIRRRLKAVAEAAPAQAGEILEWEEGDGELPGEAVTHVRGLDDAGRDEFCNGLMEHLTTNPYVNLALLRRKLLYLDKLLDHAAIRDCLESYLRRASLDELVFTVVLTDMSVRWDVNGELTQSQVAPAGDSGIHTDKLLLAGILATIPGTQRYRVDPAVVALFRQLAAHGTSTVNVLADS